MKHQGWKLYISYGILAYGGILVMVLVVIILKYCCFYRVTSHESSPINEPPKVKTH
ncbi:Protein WEAK CHLOROPLAST MOVEMENT UNDER BLUE LIGHT-like 3, partial [Clarias magur]